LNYNKLISGEELAEKMSAQLKDTAHIRIVSAYLTYPAIQWLQRYTTHTNIMILGRFRPIDFLSGASNISAIEAALDRGYKVYMLENLHAKIYQLDQKSIFAGSANFTSKGFSLCSTPNTEVAVELPNSIENQAYIDKLFRSAINVDDDMLMRMKIKLDDYLIDSKDASCDKWNIEIQKIITDLFISDLPLCAPFEDCELYQKNASLDFAKISLALGNLKAASIMFKETKCYQWLHASISSNYVEGIRFGELSKIIHDAIKDDPSPYRKKVKELQVNLLKYIELLASDVFEIHQPGARSQVLKMRDY